MSGYRSLRHSSSSCSWGRRKISILFRVITPSPCQRGCMDDGGNGNRIKWRNKPLLVGRCTFCVCEREREMVTGTRRVLQHQAVCPSAAAQQVEEPYMCICVLAAPADKGEASVIDSTNTHSQRHTWKTLSRCVCVTGCLAKRLRAQVRSAE